MVTKSICPYCKLIFKGAHCKRSSCVLKRFVEKGHTDQPGKLKEMLDNGAVMGVRTYSTEKEVIDTVGVVTEEWISHDD